MCCPLSTLRCAALRLVCLLPFLPGTSHLLTCLTKKNNIRIILCTSTRSASLLYLRPTFLYFQYLSIEIRPMEIWKLLSCLSIILEKEAFNIADVTFNIGYWKCCLLSKCVGGKRDVWSSQAMKAATRADEDHGFSAKT